MSKVVNHGGSGYSEELGRIEGGAKTKGNPSSQIGGRFFGSKKSQIISADGEDETLDDKVPFRVSEKRSGEQTKFGGKRVAVTNDIAGEEQPYYIPRSATGITGQATAELPDQKLQDQNFPKKNPTKKSSGFSFGAIPVIRRDAQIHFEEDILEDEKDGDILDLQLENGIKRKRTDDQNPTKKSSGFNWGRIPGKPYAQINPEYGAVRQTAAGEKDSVLDQHQIPVTRRKLPPSNANGRNAAIFPDHVLQSVNESDDNDSSSSKKRRFSETEGNSSLVVGVEYTTLSDPQNGFDSRRRDYKISADERDEVGSVSSEEGSLSRISGSSNQSVLGSSISLDLDYETPYRPQKQSDFDILYESFRRSGLSLSSPQKTATPRSVDTTESEENLSPKIRYPRRRVLEASKPLSINASSHKLSPQRERMADEMEVDNELVEQSASRRHDSSPYYVSPALASRRSKQTPEPSNHDLANSPFPDRSGNEFVLSPFSVGSTTSEPQYVRKQLFANTLVPNLELEQEKPEPVAEVRDYSVLGKEGKMLLMRPELSNPNQHSKEEVRIAGGKSDFRTRNKGVKEAIGKEDLADQVKYTILEAVFAAAAEAKIDLKQATKIILLAREMDGLTSNEERKKILPDLLRGVGEDGSKAMINKVSLFSNSFQRNTEQREFYTANKVSDPTQYGMRIKKLTEDDVSQVFSLYCFKRLIPENMDESLPIIDQEQLIREFNDIKALVEAVTQNHKPSSKPSARQEERTVSKLTGGSLGRY